MAAHRLATYGTLAPGQVNHHELADLDGAWSTGVVRGDLAEEGWGAAHGCPGIYLNPEGPEIAVHIFESADLPAHWDRLDAFEGDGYRRVTTPARTPEGDVLVSIYELKPPS
ncbi:MAG: gamma-glutamylcyclotransferase [Pseudomonadota bacterium]